MTTACQISDNIIVLYRGSVAEAGDVELVVRRPEHPYTQLLINSVPEPDPEHPWGAVEMRVDGAQDQPADTGPPLALEQLDDVMSAAGSSTRTL